MATPPLPEGGTDFDADIATNNLLLSNLTKTHDNLDLVELASLFLEPILVNLFLSARRPVDEELTSLDSCATFLSSKPELHRLLKVAHTEKNYTRVTESHLIPPFVSLAARSYLETLRPEMEKLVRGEKPLQLWSPPPSSRLDEGTLRHIESLQLCCPGPFLVKEFSIILHDLGGFKNDPVLHERTARIFTRQNKFLVNSSGTGKTRLLYEGLCSNWGLYFTMAVDTGGLGIGDIEAQGLNFRTSDDFKQGSQLKPEAMERNSEFVSRVFDRVLLARLLIFQLFLETAASFSSGVTEEHKKRWLLLQLTPHMLNPPQHRGPTTPFEKLLNILEIEDGVFFREDIADAIRKIRILLGNDPHFFIVLDEAQAAIDLYPKSFAHERPFLSEIMRAWESHRIKDRSFIFAGTDIPKVHFDGADKEGSDYFWCSGTGGFDHAETQSQYISRFLPPSFSTSPSGSLLISRMSRWLLGRHRFTSKFISALLLEGFATPHTRLNSYIQNVTRICPFDAVDQVEAEKSGVPSDGWQAAKVDSFDFSKIPLDAKTMFMEILFQYMATHQATPSLGPDHIDLVSKGYGRCVDTEMNRIVVDEPLVLVGAALELLIDPSSHPDTERYTLGDPNKYPGTFLGSMRLNAPRTARALSHCLVFQLSRIFRCPRHLADVFHFPYKVPPWANQSAQLVKFCRNESLEVEHSVISGDDPASPLAKATISVEETISWLEHHQGTTFCLPSSSSPDLLFSLKLSDGTFIWVALRSLPSAQPVSDADLKTTISQLGPESLFADEGDPRSSHSRALKALQALPHRTTKLGKYSLLRVVCSFPEEIDLERCVTKRSRDVACFSLSAFEGRDIKAEDEDDELSWSSSQMSEEQPQALPWEVTQTEFFESVVAGVLAGQKRKADSREGSPGSIFKRQRSAEPQLEASPDPAAMEPVTSPKRQKGEKAKVKKSASKAKAPKAAIAVDTTSTPVSRNTRSKTRAAEKGKGRARA
ncbi:hypothetical protein C8R43DRAFT_240075 [Mycena crocata]|nr:hypothetical protein C8R43DRAFT_240075 [Mycena crocata]